MLADVWCIEGQVGTCVEKIKINVDKIVKIKIMSWNNGQIPHKKVKFQEEMCGTPVSHWQVYKMDFNNNHFMDLIYVHCLIEKLKICILFGEKLNEEFEVTI